MVRSQKCWTGKLAVSLLILALVVGTLSGAVAATDGESVTVEGSDEPKNSTAYSASSEGTDEPTISTTASEDSGFGEREVAVSAIPKGGSFDSAGTMEIFVGAFNSTGTGQSISEADLNVTVQRPDGTTTQFTVTTGAQGNAQVNYNLSADDQTGTYEITVSDTNSTASVTVYPVVGSTIGSAERTFEQVPTGEQSDLTFLVRNGEFGQADELVNITIEDPDGATIDEYQTQTDEDGFVSVPLTPQERGQYQVTAELVSTDESTQHRVSAGEMVFRTEVFDLTQNLAGEKSYYSGYVLDGDGLVRNTEIVVEFRNESNVIVANETTVTGDNGFLIVDYVPNESEVPDGNLDVVMRTADGTRILTSTRIDVDDPSPGADDGTTDRGVDFSFEERDFNIAPGESSTYDIEVTDNGTAVSNQEVRVFARLGFDGPPVASTTVTTDDNGKAVVSIPTINGYNGATIYAEATAEYNGSTYRSSEFTDIKQYDIELDTPYDATAGENVNFTARAENLSSNDAGEGIPVQFNALKNGDDVDSYATGEIVTNESGIGVKTVSVPRDLEPYNAWTDWNRYEQNGASGYRVNVFQLPGSAVIENDREVQPGDQVTINFTTPDETTASGVVFATFRQNNTETFAEGNSITTVSTDADGTLTVPEYAADNRFVPVEVWAADTNGNFYTARTSLEVNATADSGGGDSDDDSPLGVTLSSSTNTVEAESNFTLTAEANQTIEEYRWDLNNDGNINRVTSSPSLTETAVNPGEYTMSVTAVATDGDTATATTDLTVTDTTVPTPVLNGPSTIVVGETALFDAANSTDNSYVANYTWKVSNGSDTVRERTTASSNTSFTFSETGEYTLTLITTDSVGNTNTTTQNFTVVTSANLVTAVNVDDPQRFGETVDATVIITNTGNQATTEFFTVEYAYAGESHGNNVIINETGTFNVTQSLAENESIQHTVDLTGWVKSNRITGDVTVTGNADANDNISDARVTDNTDSAVFEVTYADLTTTVSTPSAATSATATEFRAYVGNNGTATSTASNVTITVANSSGEVFSTEEQVNAVNTTERNRTVIAPTLVPGTYNVTAEVADPSFPADNTTTRTVTVDPYNVTAESSVVPDDLEVGQNTTVAFKIEPNDDPNVNATLSLDGTGLAFRNTSNDSISTILTPESNSPNIVTYELVAVNATNTPSPVTFTATEISGADSATVSDETNVSIVTETVTNSTSLIHQSEDESGAITVYNNSVTQAHTINASVQAGVNGRTLQGLEYLVNYPYGCVEQTTSAFLGALNTDQYYRDRPNADISDSRQLVINGSIADGVSRLNQSGERAQQSDGSWNMWGRSNAPGDTFYSVYALYGTSQVATDPIHSERNTGALDGVDFDQAVVWLNDEDQNADGSFSAYSYIEDPEAMTGFTMVAVNNTAQTERVTADTQENITKLQGEGADYLLEKQEADGTWNNGDARSTALAVRGLQVALDNGATSESEYNKSQIRTAIGDGRSYLIKEQNSDGSWDPYYDSSYWNEEGDRSVTTAYALLALDETGMDAENETITNGTDYLTTVYERDGSWGYPRATAISIDALDQLTGSRASGTMTLTFDGADGMVDKTVTVNESSSQISISLTENELETLRGTSSGTTNVSVTVSDDGDSGTIIIGIESTQEIVADNESDNA